MNYTMNTTERSAAALLCGPTRPRTMHHLAAQLRGMVEALPDNDDLYAALVPEFGKDAGYVWGRALEVCAPNRLPF